METASARQGPQAPGSLDLVNYISKIKDLVAVQAVLRELVSKLLRRLPWRELPQAPFGEGVTGARLEVALERFRLYPVRKGHIGHKTSRSELGGMGRLTGVVVLQPLLEVCRQTNITMRGRLLAFDQVDIMHSGSPSSLKLRRASCFASMVNGNPAKRVSAKQDGGGGGIRTHETVSRPHAFQACALSHSATPPVQRAARNLADRAARCNAASPPPVAGLRHK